MTDKHVVVTGDGVSLLVYHVAATEPASARVVLAHGTYSSARDLLFFARFLAKRGLDCWLFDQRGHGSSPPGMLVPTFERIARGDVPALLSFVRKKPDALPLFWIGHSGGGLTPLMWWARMPEEQLTGLVCMGAQATGAGRSFRTRGLLALAYLHSVGRRRLVPGRFGAGRHPEWAATMREWYRWNLLGRWRGPDGFDYDQAIRQIQLPALFVAGADDRLIAPVSGCRALFERVGSKDKELLVAEGLGHADLVASRRAARSLWPAIVKWLEARSGACGV